MAPDEADTLNAVKKSYLEKTEKDLSARRFVDDDPYDLVQHLEKKESLLVLPMVRLAVHLVAPIVVTHM